MEREIANLNAIRIQRSRLNLTKSDLVRDALVCFFELGRQPADVLTRRNLVKSLIKINCWLWLYQPELADTF